MRRHVIAFLLLPALVLPACGGGASGDDASDTDTFSDLVAPDADAIAPDEVEPADTDHDASVVCIDPVCTVKGVTKCQDPATVVTCVDPDGDGCFAWGEASTCETGLVCSNGTCAATCSSECTVAAATKCEGESVLTCADRNDDGCLEWGDATPCGAALTCSGGVCVDVCSSECTFDGATKCDGNATATCGDANGDGCFEWGTPVPCGGGQTCSGGACLDQCQPECDAVDDTTCFANSVATCGDVNGDGCLLWGTPVACGDDRTCVDGACSDQPVPAGVRLNEVYYDGEGADADSFVELSGPAGTVLDGFVLVGVAGGSGQDQPAVVLTGSIGADGFFLVAQDTAPDPWKALADQLDPEVELSNGPDSVQLRFGALVIDALAYGEFDATDFPAGEGAPALDVQGASLGRYPDGADTNANAVDFTPQQPSPGAPNSGPDLCYDKTCDTPTPAACNDGVSLRVWTAPGTCADGVCTYGTYTDVPCAQGCENGACKGDVPSTAGDVLISEVMPKAAAGSGADTGEWFEIHNPSAMPLDLAGCTLADADPPGVPITSSLVVPAGGYVVLAVSGDPVANYGLVAPYVYSGFSLSNEGEPLSLTCGGVLIDVVTWTANMVHEGVAIQVSKQKLDASANDDLANWCEATVPYGTAGKKGTPGSANGTCPPLIAATTPDTAGQLVISELMAKSQAGGGDKGEWFELVNVSGKALDLKGCWLADKTPEQFQFVEPVIVPAGGILVLALSNNPTVNFGLVDPYVYGGFSLSNEGEALSLTCGGTVIDAIAYTVDWVTEGVAFQLSATKQDATANDNSASWCAATASYGSSGKKGTPGTANLACP